MRQKTKDCNLQYMNGFITEFELAIIWLIAFILATLDIFEAFRYQYYVVYVYYSNHMLPKSISLWLKYGNQLLIYHKYQVFHIGHMIWSLWNGHYNMGTCGLYVNDIIPDIPPNVIYRERIKFGSQDIIKQITTRKMVLFILSRRWFEIVTTVDNAITIFM